MKKRGRPKVKKAEFKKVFPMRFSDVELRAFEAAAGDLPLREWMRKTLVASVPEGSLPELSLPVRQSIDKASVNAAMKRMAAGLNAKRGPA